MSKIVDEVSAGIFDTLIDVGFSNAREAIALQDAAYRQRQNEAAAKSKRPNMAKSFGQSFADSATKDNGRRLPHIAQAAGDQMDAQMGM